MNSIEDIDTGLSRDGDGTGLPSPGGESPPSEVIPVETIALLQGMLWSNPDTRQTLESNGVSLTPSNFYSSTPSLSEIEASFESRVDAPYANEALFDAGRLAGTLGELKGFSRELVAPISDDPDSPEGFFWENGQFGYSDALSYYAFIRSRKPKRIVEIGAGYSTLVASKAIEANGFGSITCIEPFPRPFLESTPHVEEVVKVPVQDIDAGWINAKVADDDILFIDSTHTVKIGSDCLHIYLRLLPNLQHRLLVHVHDVFLPDGMPAEWARNNHIYWTEQYLLLAYLLDNPSVQVEWGSHYHLKYNRESLQALGPSHVLPGGSSFWFTRTPSLRA